MTQPQLPAPSEPAQEEPQGGSFWDHIGELRKRLMYIVWALVLGFVVAWAFREQLFQMATAPIYTALAPYGIYRLLAIHTGEAMMVYVKLCFVADLLFALPFSIYQLWAFVRPGLLPHEIRPIRRVVVLAMFFFVIGVLFCYRVVLPFLIDFMASFTVGAGDVDFQLTMDSAYSTTLNTMLMFGAIFELPLAMVLLTALPFLTWRNYVKFVRYAIVLSFVVGAILTPPDVVSQILMSVPLCGLYGIGILLSWLLDRARSAGRPPRGVDWSLLIMTLLLAAATLPFVWPRAVDPRNALPPGLNVAVSVVGDFDSLPTCPGLPLVQPQGDAESALWTCALYQEGALQLSSVQDLDASIARCAELEASDPSLRCHVADGTLVLGPRFLVAGWEGRLDQGESAASPLTQVLAQGTVVFARAGDPSEASAPYLLAFFPQAQGAEPSVVLGARSAAEASGLVLLVQESLPPSQATQPLVSDRETRMEQALVRLTDAVDLLSRQSAVVPPAVTSALLDARTLLTLQPPPAPTALGSDCDSLGCLTDRLLPHLNNPQEIAQQGRQVVFQVDPPSQAQLEAIRQLFIH